MFRQKTVPFLTPEPTTITAEAWHYVMGDERHRLPKQFDNWTQGTPLRLTRNIEIDRNTIIEQTGLPENAELAIVVSWFSDATKIRRRVFRAPIHDHPLNVVANLNGDEISAGIELRTSLIVNRDVADCAPWVANRVGSVLLDERFRFTLDRAASGFPMAVVDFSVTHLPAAASWHLESSTVLDSRFSSSFQVLINEKDKALIAALEADKPNKVQSLLLDNLISEVLAETLRIAYALRCSGELELEGHEYGSVGEVLANLVKRTGDVPVDISSEAGRLPLIRTQFEALVRELGVGRLMQ